RTDVQSLGPIEAGEIISILYSKGGLASKDAHKSMNAEDSGTVRLLDIVSIKEKCEFLNLLVAQHQISQLKSASNASSVKIIRATKNVLMNHFQIFMQSILAAVKFSRSLKGQYEPRR